METVGQQEFRPLQQTNANLPVRKPTINNANTTPSSVPKIVSITYFNGSVYHTLEKSLPNAVATVVFDNGKVYEGNVTNGELTSDAARIYIEGKYDYQGPTKKGIPCGEGHYKFYRLSDGAIYEGATSQNKFNGRGTITFANGNTYAGEFLDGQRTGFGTEVIKETGEIYNGQFKKGKRDGTGTVTYVNQTSYTGEFKDGLQHGKGEVVLEDGRSALVEYHMGRQFERFHYGDAAKSFTGYALFYRKMANGHMTEYLGDVVRGEMQGKGRLTDMVLGDIYVGDFDHDCCHGDGEITFMCEKFKGDKYQGQFCEHKQHGHGVYTYAHGDVYDGNWENGSWHGQGKLSQANGDYIDGVWEDGECIRGIKFYKELGVRYEGKFKNGERDDDNGKATWVAGPYCGDVYEGDFVGDVRTGKAKYTWANGGCYVGDFVDGLFEGEGVLTYPDKSCFSGTFVRGEQTYGKHVYSDRKTTYVGPFFDRKPDGRGGIMTLPNGRRFVGTFSKGAYIGPEKES